MRVSSLTLALLMLVAPTTNAGDSVLGAWGTTETSPEGKALEVSVLFTERHQVAAWYDGETGALVSTNGGTWTLDGDVMSETVEFDSGRPERAGSDVSFTVAVTATKLSIVDAGSSLDRIRDQAQDALNGAWERAEVRRGGKWHPAGGENQKTVRLMFDGRFQEITFDPSTGKVLATRGGKYRLDKTNYSEQVTFRSADSKHAESSSWRFERGDDASWYLHHDETAGEAWRPL